MPFTYLVLDPRPASLDAEAAKIIATPTLGIEVTVPALAALCRFGNIDPQHTDGNVDRCAAEVAMTVALPPAGATLATVRLDVDSAAAMAVLSLRAAGRGDEIVEQRLWRIAAFDKFSNSGVWSPLDDTRVDWAVRALAKTIANFKSPVQDRVEAAARFLTGSNEFVDMVPVLKTEWEQDKAESRVDVRGSIALVVSQRQNATAVGYAHAPVVIALNPAFTHAANPTPHAKFTVCQYAPGYIDLRGALAELQALEPGWGGSPTIVGSPQGVASTLDIEQVYAVVAKYLK